MKKIIANGISWVTDGKSTKKLGLPENIVLDVEDNVKNGDIADILSDEFGYPIDSIEEIRGGITAHDIDLLLKAQKKLSSDIYNTLVNLLMQYGATSRETSIKFDWDGGCAPSLASVNFGDDLCDTYITSIYVDGRYIYIDLNAYYLQEDVEDVLITEEPNADDGVMLDIMSCITTFFSEGDI